MLRTNRQAKNREKRTFYLRRPTFYKTSLDRPTRSLWVIITHGSIEMCILLLLLLLLFNHTAMTVISEESAIEVCGSHVLTSIRQKA